MESKTVDYSIKKHKKNVLFFVLSIKKHYLCVEMDKKKQDIAYCLLPLCIEQYWKNAKHLTVH